jgi:hypothetical protein
MKKTPSEGWILYHRESRKHHLRSNPLVWNYWIHCLEEAAWKDHNVYWNGGEFMLKRGSFITSIAKEMAKLGCTRSNLRTARKVLESCTMINLSSSRAGTLIEVTNFNEWQDWEKIRNQATDQELTKQPPRANQQLTNRSPQQNKGNKLNKEKKENIKSAGAHENENGCGVDNFGLYKLYVKDGCPDISNDDIKDSWRLGLHYKEAVELFSTENP